MVTRSRFRRAITSLAGASGSQLFTSLANMVVVVAVGRGGGEVALGRFTVAFSIYLVVLGVHRSFVSVPLLATRSEVNNDVARACGGLTVVLWISAAVPISALGIATSRSELVVMALALLPLLYQDLGRHWYFKMGRYGRATLLDAVWFATSAAGSYFVWRWGNPSLTVALWAFGALVGAIYFGRSVGRVASPKVSFGWWRDQSLLSGALLFESLIYSVAAQAVVWVVVLTLGDGALGRLKAAQTIIAPATLAVVALSSVIVPHMARIGRDRLRATMRLASTFGLLMSTLSAGVLLWFGPQLRNVLFGSSFDIEYDVFIPVAAAAAVAGLGLGVRSALLVENSQGRIVGLRAVSSLLTVALVAGLATPFGLEGAAWGMAAGAGLYGLLGTFWVGTSFKKGPP